MDNLLETPIYPIYQNYGAKIINFAGWALPVQFEGIVYEHHAVRETAGLFDVSHMGEIEVKGEDSTIFLNQILTNDIINLKDGQVQYSILANESGGTKDDVLVYRFSERHYWVVVNASNRYKDFKWLIKHSTGYQVNVNDISDNVAQFALQGPKALEILNTASNEDVGKIRFFRFIKSVKVNGITCLVSRTGYTGEDGFELYFNPSDAVFLWKTLLNLGKDYGLKPAGLGCRDTLRFEACLPLYGNELDEDISPLEAGLDWVVKFNKPDFIGKQALTIQKENGIKRKIVGFEMLGRGIPRHGYRVYKNEMEIGYVTTGYYSPTLEKNIGMALVSIKYSNPGEIVYIIIRDKPIKAVIVETPFYNKKYKK